MRTIQQRGNIKIFFFDFGLFNFWHVFCAATTVITQSGHFKDTDRSTDKEKETG
jgi:hypothetical protein